MKKLFISITLLISFATNAAKFVVNEKVKEITISNKTVIIKGKKFVDYKLDHDNKTITLNLKSVIKLVRFEKLTEKEVE